MSRGMSQTTFGKLFNVDQTAVSNWETGKNNIDIKIIDKIADEFSVPMDFVCGKNFMVTRPFDEWHRSEQEDYENAHPAIKDLLLFKFGRGYFEIHEESPNETEKPAENGAPKARILDVYKDREKALIEAYRNNPGMQGAIDRLLGIEDNNSVFVYEAAASEDHHRDRYIEKDKEKHIQIKGTPNTDENLL